MKKIVLISIIVFTLQACGEENGNTEINKDTTAAFNSATTLDTTKTLKDTVTTVLKLDTLQQKGTINDKLLGFWALLDDENASFEIKKGKIFYPEFSKSYKYQIIGDSMKIKYDDYEDMFAFKMRGIDTLVLTGDDEQVYYRFKK
jgi:hypothetical protein